MRPKKPTIEFIMTGILCAASLVTLIFTLLSEELSLGMILASVAVLLGSVGGLMYLFMCWRKALVNGPDFYTKQGTAVWTNGVRVTQLVLEQAIEHYVTVLVKSVFRSKDLEASITEAKLRKMLKKLNVWWSLDLLPDPPWEGDPDCKIDEGSGLQSGYNVKVHWKGSIAESALYHEMHHVIDEMILQRHDSNHALKYWWAVVKVMKDTLRI